MLLLCHLVNLEVDEDYQHYSLVFFRLIFDSDHNAGDVKSALLFKVLWYC